MVERAEAETREELEHALVRLPVIYRTAVVLHDAEGLPASDRLLVERHLEACPTARRCVPAWWGRERPLAL